MRIIFLSFILMAFCACSTTHFYLVRHAEKQSIAGNMSNSDPELTDAGIERAKALADTLHTISLTACFSTSYKRAFQTAEPTVHDHRIALYRYDANGSNALLDSLSGFRNKNYLVVGHSNTVPDMLRHLGLHPAMQIIPDNDYDNFFVVTVSHFFGKHFGLKQSTYGKISP